MTDHKLAIFQGKQIRRTLYKNEWYFSIIDVIEVLTETERPRKYWNDLKKKLAQEGCNELSEKIGQLKLESSDGKYYETDCANTETIDRSRTYLFHAWRGIDNGDRQKEKRPRVWREQTGGTDRRQDRR